MAIKPNSRPVGPVFFAAAVLTAICGGSKYAQAQLGATPQTLARDGTLKMNEGTHMYSFEKLGFMESTASYDERASGLRYFLGFRGGKVVFASLARRLPQQPLAPEHAAAVLKNFQTFDDRQDARSPKWQAYTRLADLYPPVGNVSGELVEQMRRTGIQVQTVTTTRFSNGRLKIDFSGWNDLMRNTGVYLPEVVTKFGYRLILESRDGGAMAFLDVNYEWVDSPHADDVRRPRPGPNVIIFMTPEVFWEYVLRSEVEGAPKWGSAYLGIYDVPLDAVKLFVRRRGALAFVRYAELSGVPQDEVLARYRDVLQDDPASESDVAELLLNSNFGRLGTDAMARHFLLAGEIGGPALVEEFVKKMPKTGEGKAQAAAALAQIAERHQLPAPPAADASANDWTAWAVKAGAKK